MYAAVWLLKRTAVYISLLLAREREKNLLSFNLGSGGVSGQVQVPASFLRERDPLPVVQLVDLNPGPVWTIARNFAPNGIWSPDGPVSRQSLYWVSYYDYALLAHIFY